MNDDYGVSPTTLDGRYDQKRKRAAAFMRSQLSAQVEEVAMDLDGTEELTFSTVAASFHERFPYHPGTMPEVFFTQVKKRLAVMNHGR